MRRLVLAVCALVAAVYAAGSVAPLKFKDNVAIGHTLDTTSACTTQVYTIANQPYQSFWFQLYQSANGGDSAVVAVSYRVSDNAWHFPVGWTVIDTVYGSPHDTLRTAAQRFGLSYRPKVSQFIQLKFAGVGANGANTMVDSLGLCLYHDGQ